MYLPKLKGNFKSVVGDVIRRNASVKSTSCWDNKLVRTCPPCNVQQKQQMCDDDKPCPKVAILGAGMAGMSAASKLCACGMDNIVVLEATNRVGGRIFSSWSGEGVIELGAEWLEGEWNSVLRLAALEGLTPCTDDTSCGSWLNDSGELLEETAIEEGKVVFNQVMDEAIKTFCDQRESDFFGVSLLDFIKQKEKKIAWEQPQAKVVFETLSRAGLCKIGGPPNELSLNDLAVRFRSDVRTRIREGLVGVFGPLMKDVPKDKIKFKHKVLNVHWDECPIRIVFENCSEMTADIVIVTFSVGVLRNNPELFDPELPEDKGEAFRNTGYDTVNKIFLDYAEPFWLRGDGRVFLPKMSGESSNSWTSSIYHVREICGGRNTLQLALCGRPALEVETVTEEEIAKEVTCILRKHTGVKSTPFPIAVTRTRWSIDPCFQGSITYMGKHCNKKHLRSLAQPLPPLSQVPKLLFAGDATSGGYIGTVEGARLSGFREAQRILDIVCGLGWPPKPRHNLDQFMYNQK